MSDEWIEVPVEKAQDDEWLEVPLEAAPAETPNISNTEVALRGAGQAIPIGDEVMGVLGGTAEQITNALGTSGQAVERYTSTGDIPGRTGVTTEGPVSRGFGDAYRENRDEYRAADKAAQEANPALFTGSQVGASIATAALPGGLIAQGAAQGLMGSEADLTKGDVGGALYDTAVGGTIGAGFKYGGKALGMAADKIGLSDLVANSRMGKAFSGGKNVSQYGDEGVRTDLANDVTKALDDIDTNAVAAHAQARQAFLAKHGDTPVDTSEVVAKTRKMLERYGPARTEVGGDVFGPIGLKDSQDLARYTGALSKPNKASDVYRIWDDLNNKIPQVDAKLGGPKMTEYQRQLEALRDGIKHKLHEVDPAGLKIADEKMERLIDNSKLIRSAKTDSQNESFISTLGGANKGNRQTAFKEVMAERPDILQKVEDHQTWKSFNGQGGFGSDFGIRNLAGSTLGGAAGYAAGDNSVAGGIGATAGAFLASPRTARAMLTSGGHWAKVSEKYRKILADAAKRGGNSLATMHFVLSHQDKQYQEETREEDE